MSRVLAIGETWTSHISQAVGLDVLHSSSYTDSSVGLRDALARHGHAVTHLPNHLVGTDFPEDGLDRFDVVMLGDVSAQTLVLSPAFASGLPSADRLAMLADFVRAGGGLLMVGGYLSFGGVGGRGRYAGTAIADILPVVVSAHDDRRERPAGSVPVSVSPHPVLTGLEGDWPRLLGFNATEMRPEAHLLMTIDGEPLLAVRTVERGRTAAFTSDPCPHWGSQPFTSWPQYGRFFGQLIDWVGGS